MADAKPCHFFQIGNCKNGACKFAHTIDPNFQRRLCVHFAKNRCKRGVDCKFSHDETSNANGTAATGIIEDGIGSASTEYAFKEWRYKIPVNPSKARPLGSGLSSFCQTALELVEGEPGVMQEVITLLAAEGGTVRIAELLGQRLENLTDSQLGLIFDAQLLPFFQAVSHKNVFSSPILESRLMTIYNFVFGIGGQRAVALFSAVTRHLSGLNMDHTGDGEDSFHTTHVLRAFESSLTVLSKTVEVNSTAQVTEGLRPIVETLAAILAPFEKNATYQTRAMLQHMHRIEQRLGLGRDLPSPDRRRRHDNKPRPTFEIAREMPGELSEDGPRHDNDSVDIRNISILPTLQEIQSSRTEYMPLADPQQWHLGGLEGLLDRHFRLLREDTVGQLRDAAKFELERLQNPTADRILNDRKRQGARTYVYEGVRFVDTAFNSFKGLEFVLGFQQPLNLQSKTNPQRKEWWESSKRFGPDALICHLSSAGSVIFLAVSEQRPDYRKQKSDVVENNSPKTALHERYSLWSDKQTGYIVAKLVNRDNSDVERIIEQMISPAGAGQASLVEFPGVLLPAFQPTLEAMQKMSSTLDVPFSDILAAPSAIANLDETEINPPAYSTKPRFAFELSPITRNGEALYYRPGDAFEMSSLTERSTLDCAQAEALISSLGRGLALIQGPPGTGKSFTGVALIKVLLQSRKELGGPVVCVCMTNHALDQLLEHLVDAGVHQIIRIGSRSKSERLAELNIRHIAHKVDLTKTEKEERWKIKKKIESESKEIDNILGNFSLADSQQTVEAHLLATNVEHYRQLFSGIDEEGFETVTYHPEETLKRWRCDASVMSHRPTRPIHVLQTGILNELTSKEREVLYNSWIAEIRENLQDRLMTALQCFNHLKSELDLITKELDMRAMKSANVIGITTSGLARNLGVLRKLNSKVLVCEEAGEVLEAHLLTALLPTVEHAILIGDHQQLRPQVQNYELSCDSPRGQQYALDVSLFERLVQPKDVLVKPIPFCTLNVQRRMHPSISRLICQTLYPTLQDASMVSAYPQVTGMRRRLFWMNHCQPEDSSDVQSTSYTNSFEVEMTAALVSHLVRQGIYRSEDIAIITPYLGQLRMIRKRLSSSFEILLNDRDVDDLEKEESDGGTEQTPKNAVARGTLLQALRVATVDNFQGEEARVIVVSLVRSNDRNKCGFLRTTNRINVLLSRAKHGMYILGNANTSAHVKMWADVIRLLKIDGNFGDALELCCPRHMDTAMFVKGPEDFLRVAPEAGCDLRCSKQLSCGHACVNKCHSEVLHNAVYCMKECTRPKAGCNHICPLPCGSKCHQKCEELVERLDLELDCGHRVTSLPCWQFQDPSLIKCMVKVQRTVPGCFHTVEVSCCYDVSAKTYECRAECGDILSCGHTCNRMCNLCNSRSSGSITARDHGTCKRKCGRDYTTCQHCCKAACHGKAPCPLCEAKCEVKCSHASCDKKCHEPCAPCAEQRCASHCPHSACRMPCAAPCDWLPCSKRCDSLLGCGHRCPSVCGEVCPPPAFCQVCASDDVKGQQADLVMFETYGNIDLDEESCIFTSCNHIFTVTSMDGIMGMTEHYEQAVDGSYTSLKASSDPFSAQGLKNCPSCRGSLRNLARYGRIVRRALLDESTMKFTAWTTKMYDELATRLAANQEKLIGTAETAVRSSESMHLLGESKQIITAIKGLRNSKRYRNVLSTRNYIRTFVDKSGNEEQPFQRVRDLVETARRRRQGSDIQQVDLHVGVLDTRAHLLATSLLIRCDIIIISDAVALHHSTTQSAAEHVLATDFSAQRTECEELVAAGETSKSFRQQVEGFIFWARFAAMECGAANAAGEKISQAKIQEMEALKRLAINHLGTAAAICKQHDKPTEGLSEEVREVQRMLNEATYSSDMRMVVAAMAKEFSGTGHWYRCVNNHLFTIGECGMPMQEAKCPACGEGIGGQSHRAVDGVTHARDFEERFGNLNL